MPRRDRVVLVLTVALFVLLCALAAVLRSLWAGSIPPRSGTFAISGLREPVEIRWDPRGAPTVNAGSLEDAVAAEGFLHGLLRPLQVELQRRSAAGELAAVGGPGLFDLDEDAFLSGIEDAAGKEAPALPDFAGRCVAAYVSGLNTGLALAARRAPPEVRLARVDLKAWAPRDVVAFGRRFTSLLNDATASEKARLDLLCALGVDDAGALWQAAFGEPFPPVPGPLREILGRAAGSCGPARRTSRRLDDLRETTGQGSNAWAVSPARSATGGALLAGDPHLDYQLPAIWFEVRLRWPGGALAGASLPGTPGVLIGHNNRVAWSFTVAGADDGDLFLVEVDDIDAPTRYRERGVWRPFATTTVVLAARGAGPQRLIVRRAGPAVYRGPSGIPGFGLLERRAERERGGLIEAMLDIDLAQSAAQGLSGARKLPGPTLNFVAADADGTIVHSLAGAIPRRRGEDWDGRVPTVWSGPESWDGFLAPEDVPVALNPPEGFVVSANDDGLVRRWREAGRRAPSGDFQPEWRGDRIRSRLEQLPRATAEDMAQLQLDVRSGAAAALQKELLACRAKGPAAEMYLHWDGAMQGAGGPLLHEVFRSVLSRRLRLRTRLGAATGAVFAGTRPTVNLVRASRDDPWIANWLDDPATSWPETGCEHLRLALDEAWQAVRNRVGEDVSAWKWAPRHRLSLRSPVGVGLLARWFNPAPVDLPGASDTIDAEAYRALRGDWDGKPFAVVHGPSYRLLVAFDGQGTLRSQSAFPGGQDEHPAARHAFDRLGDYAAGVLRALSPPDESNDAPLRLTPAAPATRP